MKSYSAIQFPRLAFGDAQADINLSYQCIADLWGLSDDYFFEPLTPCGDFYAKAALSLNVNGLALTASMTSPLRESGCYHTDVLMLTSSGNCFMQSEGYSGYTCRNLIFMPSGARYIGQSNEGLSGVGITLDRSRLQEVFRTMLASDETLLFPDHIEGFPLFHGLLNFQGSFDLLFRQIDALSGDADFLAHSGFDDSFYRHVLMVLQTERLSKKPKGKEKIGPIDNLCEYLAAHFSERITLTQMEQISGLSARSLQYSFLERFGCAPTIWLRNFRLDRARQQLRRIPQQKTITQIAYDCGFSSVSQFGQYYRQRFGIPPSASVLQRYVA